VVIYGDIHRKNRLMSRMELTQFLGQRWEFVYVFACISTMRNAKAKLEVECLQESVTEEVPFYHPKVLHRFRSHSELHSETDQNQFICFVVNVAHMLLPTDQVD
jgi:hypothetical protein